MIVIDIQTKNKWYASIEAVFEHLTPVWLGNFEFIRGSFYLQT